MACPMRNAPPSGTVTRASLMQDARLQEKLSHFNRERIAPRVCYAKGTGAAGYFVVTHDIAAHTTARFLSRVGRRTPLFLRFSHFRGDKGAADTRRDHRGAALKLYTEEGNLDLVCASLPVYPIRDAARFPDLVRALRRHPRTGLEDPRAFWDFLSLQPCALHYLLMLFSDRGLPDGFAHMPFYSGHVLKLVDASGHVRFAKWHFTPAQGIRSLDPTRAARLAASDPDYAVRDLQTRIDAEAFPTWTAWIQLLDIEQVAALPWDPLDVTKVWPHALAPLLEVGRIVLNRVPENDFNATEQAAFSPANLVPGIEATYEMQARLFAYRDTQYHRLGPNFAQIPVNTAYMAGDTPNHWDGQMHIATERLSSERPHYFPNTTPAAAARATAATAAANLIITAKTAATPAVAEPPSTSAARAPSSRHAARHPQDRVADEDGVDNRGAAARAPPIAARRRDPRRSADRRRRAGHDHDPDAPCGDAGDDADADDDFTQPARFWAMLDRGAQTRLAAALAASLREADAAVQRRMLELLARVAADLADAVRAHLGTAATAAPAAAGPTAHI